MIDKTGKKTPPERPKTAADRRREKLAEALRANLKRRKQGGGAARNPANPVDEAENAANDPHSAGRSGREG